MQTQAKEVWSKIGVGKIKNVTTSCGASIETMDARAKREQVIQETKVLKHVHARGLDQQARADGVELGGALEDGDGVSAAGEDRRDGRASGSAPHDADAKRTHGTSVSVGKRGVNHAHWMISALCWEHSPVQSDWCTANARLRFLRREASVGDGLREF